MRLGTKLLLPAVLTALVALAGGALNGLMMSREATVSAQAHADDLADLRTIASAERDMGRLHTSVYRNFALMASLDEAAINRFRAQIPKDIQALQQTLQALDARRADAGWHEDRLKLEQQLARYAKQADQAIDLASVDPNTGVAAMQTAETSHAEAAASLAKGVAAVAAAAEQSQVRTQQESRRHALWLGLLSLGLTATAIALSARVLQGLVAALREATQLAGRVAEGDLATVPPPQRVDEIGDLQRSLAQMVERLRSSLLQVRQAAGSIASGSAEIATGNQDLSQRTEQAASHVQATVSSMTQLTQAVAQSADAAAQANQLAGSASAVAHQGGEAVAQVVGTMNEIHDASRRIADITGVIDGIAFQTNILALNAAVEAARAGEQGRGFAVVASEVRSLAGRSADAAREIKALIGASVDKVESGSRLAQQAGATMTDIVSSVQRVSDIIAEISASTVEQRDGIGQITTAVGQLDQSTQQNAALVEQSAAAADSMRQQAQRLHEVVGLFQLGDTAGPAAAGSMPPARPATARPAPGPVATPIAAPVIDSARADPKAVTPARPAQATLPAPPATPLEQATHQALSRAAGRPVAVRPPAPAPADDHWETF